MINDNKIGNLTKRVLTATVLITLVFGIIYLAPLYIFKSVLIFIMVIAAYEWANLSFENGPSDKRTFLFLKKGFYVVSVIICCILSSFIPVIILFGFSTLFWFGMAYMVMTYPNHGYLLQRFQFIRGLAGISVLVPFYQAILQIQLGNIYFFSPQGAHEVLIVLVFIWVADIAAYFLGRSYGETALAPRVSPGKTIAGAWGSILGAFVTVGFINLLLNHQHHSLRLWSSLVMALMLASAAILGDLFESMMKRIRGVKDSGQVLPGHGGLLDRIDSATAVFPIFIFVSLVLGHVA